MKRRRVKITGIGPVTPAGIGRDAFCSGILQSKSHVVELNRFDVQAGPFVGAEIAHFNVGTFLSDPAARRQPRHTQFALVAAQLALQDAGLEPADVRKLDPFVIIGASLMDFEIMSKSITGTALRGPKGAVARSVFNAPVAAISNAIACAIGGVVRTTSIQSACCSGLDSIGHAVEAVSDGRADIAICGGTEAPLFYHPMIDLKLAGLSPSTADQPDRLCRPFDRWRTTGVIGEGACVMVIEPEESPRPGYCFVDGYAYASDPKEDTGRGLEIAIRQACANADVRPLEVDGISAWGPGHREIDRVEAQVLQRVFGPRLSMIATTSIKGCIGNPLGAAGAIQVATVALGMRQVFWPPTVNWEFPDPACPLNLSAAPRFIGMRKVVVNGHGLSGTNSSVILSAE